VVWKSKEAKSRHATGCAISKFSRLVAFDEQGHTPLLNPVECGVFSKASPPSVLGTVLHSNYSWGEIYNFFKTARVDRRKRLISESNYALAPVI
jgi:hypothetical protein